MVCELLKANLYEFYKFNRESGGEIYFTMPRLQVVAFHFFSHFLLFSADFRSYKRLCTRAGICINISCYSPLFIFSLP